VVKVSCFFPFFSPPCPLSLLLLPFPFLDVRWRGCVNPLIIHRSGDLVCNLSLPPFPLKPFCIGLLPFPPFFFAEKEKKPFN